jgi:hypothetical protein
MSLGDWESGVMAGCTNDSGVRDIYTIHFCALSKNLGSAENMIPSPSSLKCLGDFSQR